MNYNNQKIVKRIAELEGLEMFGEDPAGNVLLRSNYLPYDPINNAGQAMELLEKLPAPELQKNPDGQWWINPEAPFISKGLSQLDESLKLAICLAYLASMGEDLTQAEAIVVRERMEDGAEPITSEEMVKRLKEGGAEEAK